MSQFVLNEWFWADLKGENGLSKKAETFEFLNRIATSDHQIVIATYTAFDNKAWGFCVTDPPLGRAFVLMLRQNSERCLILQKDQLPHFPAELEGSVKPDDRYLVQVCLAAPGSILVTTDVPLLSTLSSYGIACMTRETLLKTV